MSQSSRAKTVLALAVLASMLSAGCSPILHTNSITEASSGSADRLAEQLHSTMSRPSGRIIVTSLMPVDTLYTSTPFGQATAEQVGARLSQRGYDVVEVRLMNAIGINDRGEFALSRDARAIAQGHNAAAIVTGTYAIGADTIYVTVRAVAVDNSTVLAAQTYTLPITPDIRKMIEVRPVPPTWRPSVAFGHEGIIGAADGSLGYVHVVEAQRPAPVGTPPIPLAGTVSGQNIAAKLAALPAHQRKTLEEACADQRRGATGTPTAIIIEPVTQLDLKTACSAIP